VPDVYYWPSNLPVTTLCRPSWTSTAAMQAAAEQEAARVVSFQWAWSGRLGWSASRLSGLPSGNVTIQMSQLGPIR